MPSHDARIIRGAAIPTAVAGLIAAVIAAAVVGTKGLIGAVFATLLVMAFFSSGQVALDRLTRNNPQIMMAAALLVYTTQILLVAVVLAGSDARIVYVPSATSGVRKLADALPDPSAVTCAITVRSGQ